MTPVLNHNDIDNPVTLEIPKPDKLEANETLEVCDRQILLIMQMLASEGTLRCGVQFENCEAAHYAAIDGHPKIPVCLPEIVIETPQELLQMPRGQGNHRILVAPFGIRNPYSTKIWLVKSPAIFITHNPDCPQDHLSRDFIANPAWLELKNNAPETACKSFLEAAAKSFYCDEDYDNETGYYDDKFALDFQDCYEIATGFFLPKKLEDILLCLLKENLPTYITALGNYRACQYSWELKQIHFDRNKNTTECKLEILDNQTGARFDASCKNDDWTCVPGKHET
ncbi:hypothetical protein OH491_24315 [Termitidicoccus mucosus]|uniref:Uncharacterized protein n=1 Tax=Termitidicoccus mucosus TaxID=1184151 RepID=A0A178IQD3_9BACT|nr:hypothetical protein AW736_02125 [Opitutaceae bacterium TSB47]